MEHAEIPVIQEHSPVGGQDGTEQQVLTEDSAAAAAEQPQLQQLATPSPGEGLPPLQLGGEGTPRRWSLDASVHSDSGWEMLSHGQHSHCGSSPRSVSPSDAYDSDEGEAEVAAERAAAHHGDGSAASDSTGVAAQPAVEEPELDPEPFGSMVIAEEGQQAAQHSREEEHGAADAPLPEGEAVQAAAGCVAGSISDGEASSGSNVSSPRSSYERASNASRHDLYSLSQDGEGLSDHDSYIDDMMLAGEPDHLHLAGSAGSGSEQPEHGSDGEHEACGGGKPTVPLAAAPAAALAAAARGAFASASCQLRALAASFTAYLARIVPAGAEVAQRMVRGLAEAAALGVGSLRERVAAAQLPVGLAPLAATAAEVRQRVALAVQGVHGSSKKLGARVDWARTALVLGGACGVLAALLYRSWTEQARLASRLERREQDLAKLLYKVMELQRNITAHRSVPLLRHVNLGGPGGPSAANATWPAVIVV